MPWKESSVMEERMRFVGRLLYGESMTDLCAEFGISRKTGYKVFNRYAHGLEALTDRSRRPVRYANQLPAVLAGQKLGVKEVDEGIWLVSFMHYDLANIDLEQKTLQTIGNPFGPGVSPMS